MTVILRAGRPLKSTASEPVVALGRRNSSSTAAGPHVTVHGWPAFEQTYFCGTCPLLFQRRSGADGYMPPDRLRDQLAAGLDDLEPDIVRAFLSLLAPGSYLPILLETAAELVTPGGEGDYYTHEQLQTWNTEDKDYLPADPGTGYYRLNGRSATAVPGGGLLFEFLVPLFPPDRNNRATFIRYQRAMHGGSRPTAVAVSVLDAAYPYYPDPPPSLDASHWGWTHFLLDGHHKTEAAARIGQPLRLLSLLCLDGGNTYPRYARALPALFGAAPGTPAWPPLDPQDVGLGVFTGQDGFQGDEPGVVTCELFGRVHTVWSQTGPKPRRGTSCPETSSV